MANKKSGSRESYGTRYKTGEIWKQNKLKRIAKAIKEQPNNTKLPAMMSLVKSAPYTRKKPKNPIWTATKRKEAVLIKLFRVPESVKVSFEMPKNPFSIKAVSKLAWY